LEVTLNVKGVKNPEGEQRGIGQGEKEGRDRWMPVI
jgi:hypothetical protein